MTYRCSSLHSRVAVLVFLIFRLLQSYLIGRSMSNPDDSINRVLDEIDDSIPEEDADRQSLLRSADLSTLMSSKGVTEPFTTIGLFHTYHQCCVLTSLDWMRDLTRDRQRRTRLREQVRAFIAPALRLTMSRKSVLGKRSFYIYLMPVNPGLWLRLLVRIIKLHSRM